MLSVSHTYIADDITFELNDLNNKKDFGISLGNLVKLFENTGGVIALDGKRGSGKTFFLKMRRNYMISQGYSTIYYDVFADEYMDDIFLSMSSMFLESADSGAKKKNFKKAIKKLLPVVGKVALRYLLRGDIPQIENDAEDAIEGSFGDYVSSLIEDVLKHKEKIKYLRTTLTKMCEGEKPLIFIIDELDRCKPESVYKFFHSLKYIFSVPNVVFVVGMNKGQIMSYLEKLYGKIESSTFLHKFVDIDVGMPENSGNLENPGDATKYFFYLLESSEQVSGYINTKNFEIPEFKKRFQRFDERFNFNYRTVEKIANYLHIFLANKRLQKDTIKIFYIILLIVVFKIEKSDFYKKIQQGTLESKEVIEFLRCNQSSNEWEIAMIQYLFDKEISDKVAHMFANFESRYNINRLKIPQFYTNMFDIVNLD